MSTGLSEATHRPRWTIALRVLAALVLLAVAWPTAHLELVVNPATALPIALITSIPVLLLPEHVLRAWALSAAGALVVALLVEPLPGRTLGVQVVHLVVLGALTMLVAVRCARWAIAVAAVGPTVVVAVATGSIAWAAWTVFWSAVVVAVGLLVRRLLGQRRRLTEDLAASEEARAREQARRAVLQDRTQVAHDLHDVVAHSMSMVVVRAETARYRLPDLDPVAAEEMAAIADTARTALGEIRTMLGVLRSDEDDPPEATRPQPTLDDVDELLAETARAGVELVLAETGDRSATGSAVAVSLYRILAEALANAARHAAGARVAVTLEHDPGGVRARVAHGPGRESTGPGSGLGLPSMRTRAAAVGGELTAGPTPDGGFVVDARLPVAERVG